MNNTSQNNVRIESDRIAAAFSWALSVAKDYEGSTSPNPPVGCALMDEKGEILSCEAHQVAGQGHAEVRAIASARSNGTIDRACIAVVTLEPCNHTGRTPPCVQELLATAISDIWIACRDPNPQVAGGGAEALVRSGRTVRFLEELDDPRRSELLSQSRRLIAPFVKKKKTGIPFITVKQALDASGSMIPPKGQKTFTSDTSLKLAHQLRRRADAIVTGSGTVLADLPEFSVRHVPDFEHKKRILAILDRRRRVPQSYVLAAQSRGFTVVLDSDIDDVFHELGALGAMEVLVEAGPQLTTHILSTGQWDEHVLIRKSAEPQHSDEVTIASNIPSSF